MASLFEVPPGPTTGLQTFAVFVTFFFPAVALVVVVVRSAGRLATKQFGLGTLSPATPALRSAPGPQSRLPSLTMTVRFFVTSRRLARVDSHGETARRVPAGAGRPS